MTGERGDCVAGVRRRHDGQDQRLGHGPRPEPRRLCVIGGGNSAGQTALRLARWADLVTVLAGAQSPARCMPGYAIREIEAAPNVEVRSGVQIADDRGTDRRDSLVFEDERTRSRRSVPSDGSSIRIGSVSIRLPHRYLVGTAVRVAAVR